MRLSLFSIATTCLLITHFTHTVGFSILPRTTSATTTATTTATHRSTVTTALELSATIPEAHTTERLETNLSRQWLPQAEDDDDDEEEESDNLQQILFSLEKRINHGPGSLSLMEVEEFKTFSDRIRMELKMKEAALQSAHSLAVASPPTAGSVQTAPTVSDVQETTTAVTTTTTTTSSTTHVESAAASPQPAVEKLKPKEMSAADHQELRAAVLRVNATAVSALLESGLEMDEKTTNSAFWAIVRAVDRAEEEDKPLSGDVPQMLHLVFDADHRHLLGRDKHTTNLTCMRPEDDSGLGVKMSYIFDDSAHKDLPLTPGRACEDGRCCDACSRNIFSTFALENEISLRNFPELSSLTFNSLRRVSTATILQFTRLVERVRRTISYEYGLPLKDILPLQAYSRKYVVGATQQGGGGGEGDHVTLHTDESTHSGYHYSCVIYLSTHGEDFEGGAFVFNDPAENKEEAAANMPEGLSLEEQIRRSGRKYTPYYPRRGAAVIFSSGWENMHEVETITAGTRYAVPCFFTTCPVPEVAYDQMVVGKPQTNEDIADDWLHLLLAHRQETPTESTGRVKELLMKWHYMCAPLSEH